MGWFGDQDTKTSQEPKLWKNWKIGHFGKKFKKWHYKWYQRIILAPDVVWYLWGQEFRDHHYILKHRSSFVEEETMTRDEKGTSYDGEELIKIMEPIFEDMNKNIMKGFKLLAIQSWKKIYLF